MGVAISNMVWRFFFFLSFSIALVKFANKPDEQYIIVGMSRDLVLAPRSLSGGSLQTYKVIEGGAKLEHMHTTPVEDVPGAVAAFQGRVLIGVGRFLRVYDLGKKKLLRKCENKVSDSTAGYSTESVEGGHAEGGHAV